MTGRAFFIGANDMTDNVIRIDPKGARETRERYEWLMDMAERQQAAMQRDPQPFYDALAADYSGLRRAVWDVLDSSRASLPATYGPIDAIPAYEPLRTVTIPADEYERHKRTVAVLERLAARVGL